MRYVAFVGTDGPQPAEARAQMARDFPAYLAEMEPRGVRLAGRPLDIDVPAATVRVRDGETLVTDGPFAETKEFVGGLDVLDVADLDEAIEVKGKSPVARYLPLEIRPPRNGLRLGAGTAAFGREDDSAGVPYLFTVWADGSPPSLDEQAVTREYDGWHQELDSRGVFVLGDALGGPETATTVRVRDGELQISDGPFLDIEEFITGLDVVTCSDRRRAIAVAATHPYARYHAIEVRPFHSEAAADTQRRPHSQA